MHSIVSILFVMAGVFIIVGDVKACSCRVVSIEKRFDRADYVFTATIIGARLEGVTRTTIEEKIKDKIHYSTMDQIQIEFDPLKNYKGSSSELDFLYTNRGGASCGIEVIVGSIQTFFVKKGGAVSLCGGVLRNDQATDFYDYLAKEGLE